MQEKFYITTTLPYVNAEPHVGFAMEIIEADVLARFKRSQGKEVFFNTGTDEHGLKLFRKAQELGMDVQDYVNGQAENFKQLKNVLNLSWDNFIRTTDAHHLAAAQEFWKRCEKAGDIYTKIYKVKYCVGCELEKTDSELVDGKCPLHPGVELEIIEEENHFFRFSKYQQTLLDLYAENPEFVLPKNRLKEIKNFVAGGLEDFSISRLKEKMPWGIEVPGSPDHVMYVWFDALVNYISAIGWPTELEKFDSFWPVVQLAGKDNLRQQSAMWQAMLMSANIKPSKQILINGFITVGGQKMSKSVGNVIAPAEMVEKFGIDGTRYLLLSGGGNFGEDMDITWERLTEKYNADLANGLGNLVSRVVKLAENVESLDLEEANQDVAEILGKEFAFFAETELLDQALPAIWSKIRNANIFIEDNKPWELAKTDEENFKHIVRSLIAQLYVIAAMLVPFMPETSAKIKTALETKKVDPLFQRIK
jgi:methionyl-tRNA synthetase